MIYTSSQKDLYLNYIPQNNNQSLMENNLENESIENTVNVQNDQKQIMNTFGSDQNTSPSQNNENDNSENNYTYRKSQNKPHTVRLTKQSTLDCIPDFHFQQSIQQQHGQENFINKSHLIRPQTENQLAQLDTSAQLPSIQNNVLQLQHQQQNQEDQQNIQQQMESFYILMGMDKFLQINANSSLNKSNDKIEQISKEQIVLKYRDLKNQENTFFKSVAIIHFQHMLYNDHIDIHNLSLFDLFERVKNKKMILKPSPIQHPGINQEYINDMFCNNIYQLIKLKTQVDKFQLFQAFLNMVVKQPIFLETLMLMLKELVLETIENSQNEEYKTLQNIIHHSWVEMKPEFLSLLSQTLNKTIEVVYLLDNRAEIMKYDKLITRYNSEQTKIRLVYFHCAQVRKSFYFPILDKQYEQLFTLNQEEMQKLQQEYLGQLTAQSIPSHVKNPQIESNLFQNNLFDLPNTKIDTKQDAIQCGTQYSQIDFTPLNFQDDNSNQSPNTDNQQQKQQSLKSPSTDQDLLLDSGDEFQDCNGIQPHSSRDNLPQQPLQQDNIELQSSKSYALIESKRNSLKNKLKDQLNMDIKCLSTAKKTISQPIINSRDVVSFVEPSMTNNAYDQRWNNTLITNKVQDLLSIFELNTSRIKQLQHNIDEQIKQSQNTLTENTKQNQQDKKISQTQQQSSQQLQNKENKVQQNPVQQQQKGILMQNQQQQQQIIPPRFNPIQQQQYIKPQTIQHIGYPQQVYGQNMIQHPPIQQYHHFPGQHQGFPQLRQPQTIFLNQHIQFH